MSYDVNTLKTLANHLDKALELLINSEMENSDASEFAEEMIAYLNPQFTILEKIVKSIKDEDESEVTYSLSEPIHDWFELTRAQYLTIPRSVLQSMPASWQSRFVECLEELDEKIDWMPESGRYWVRLKDEQGRFIHDPLMDYERGRRRIPLKDLP